MNFSALTWIGVLIAAAGWSFLISGPLESMLPGAIGGKAPNEIIYLGYMLITWGVIGTGFRSLVPA